MTSSVSENDDFYKSCPELLEKTRTQENGLFQKLERYKEKYINGNLGSDEDFQRGFTQLHGYLKENGYHGTADFISNRYGNMLKNSNDKMEVNKSNENEQAYFKSKIFKHGAELMRYLHFISLFAFIGLVLFTITFIIISSSAWDSESISQEDLNHNNKYTAVKSQVDNGIYFGITTIFLWILLISIQLSE